MADNVRRGQTWRKLAALIIKVESGLPVADRTDGPRAPGAKVTPVEASDIVGLRDWSVLTRAEHSRDLSGNQDAAALAAEQDGKRWGAVAYLRADSRPTEDSFVVMSISTFAGVLKALEAAHGDAASADTSEDEAHDDIATQAQ